MKVLVMSSYAPTLFTFREDMIKEMVRGGHDVVCAAPEPEEKWQSRFQQIGVRYRCIQGVQRTGTNPFSDLVGMVSIYRLIVAEEPDRIFTYQAKTVIYGCIAAKLARISQVYAMMGGLGSVFRSEKKTSVLRQIMMHQYRLALGCCAIVFVQNPDDHDVLLDSGLLGNTEVVFTNGSGVNLDAFPERALPLNPGFLFVGRLIKDKGIMEFMEAARIVKGLYPDVAIRVVGPFDDNPTAIHESVIQRYVLDGVVQYMGPTDDVRPFIEQCSVFVLPSYHEGTPKSVLEAMAMGRPIITTDAPGCRETVVDGLNGFLVPPRDVACLVEKMVWMIEHMDEARQMGKESRRMCELKFDVRLVNNVILEAMGMRDH